MTRTIYRLTLALALSLMLHLLPFAGDLIQPAPAPVKAEPLRAQLRSMPLPVPIPLIAPTATALAPIEKTAKSVTNQTKSTSKFGQWQNEVQRQLKKQNDNGLFYPAEAIASGLQGEVIIFMILDADGQVAAARVERSSGQHILDDAALIAVRSLHSLPADAPRETLLPVRFRLH